MAVQSAAGDMKTLPSQRMNSRSSLGAATGLGKGVGDSTLIMTADQTIDDDY